MNHTKGPWELVAQNKNSMFVPYVEHPFCVVNGAPFEVLIAKVCQQWKSTEANACLIAAAPDMYQALKDLSNLAVGKTPPSVLLDYVVTLAKETLAKVEGV